MITVDKALDNLMQLDFANRELVIEIIQKRQIEERRAQLVKNVKQGKKDFSLGKLKQTTAKDLIAYLHTQI